MKKKITTILFMFVLVGMSIQAVRTVSAGQSIPEHVSVIMCLSDDGELVRTVAEASNGDLIDHAYTRMYRRNSTTIVIEIRETIYYSEWWKRTKTTTWQQSHYCG